MHDDQDRRPEVVRQVLDQGQERRDAARRSPDDDDVPRDLLLTNRVGAGKGSWSSRDYTFRLAAARAGAV